MLTIKQRVREHAIAAGMLAEDEPMNSYVAEGAAWVAEACASALDAGADLRAVALDVSETMRRAGASGAEHAFVQLVVAEIGALVHRASEMSPSQSGSHAIRANFTWTERPQAGGGIKHVLGLKNVANLSDFEKEQAKRIYVVAMLKHFGNLSRAFRAWAIWHGGPRSEEAWLWRRHHARAQALAFAGLDVHRNAAVSVRFRLRD